MQPTYWKGLDGKMKTRKVLLWLFFFFFLCTKFIYKDKNYFIY